MFYELKKYYKLDEVPKNEAGINCTHYIISAVKTGNKKIDEQTTEEFIEYNILVWVSTIKPEYFNNNKDKLRAKFIQEYLIYKGFGIDEQIAAIINEGEDKINYQAIRTEAKELSSIFINSIINYNNDLTEK